MDDRSSLHLQCRDNKLLLKARVADVEVTFLVDSGANVSVLPYKVAKDAGLLTRLSPLEAFLNNPVAEYSPTIHGVLHEPLHCAGGLKLRPLLVVMSPAIPIVGLETLIAHRCVLTCSRLRPSLRLRELHPETPTIVLPRTIQITCTIMGKPTLALLDTGATCCFISQRRARELCLEVRRQQAGVAATITGTQTILGHTAATNITFLGFSATTSFCVNDTDDRVIIGLNVLLDARVSLEFGPRTIRKDESSAAPGRLSIAYISVTFFTPSQNFLCTLPKCLLRSDVTPCKALTPLWCRRRSTNFSMWAARRDSLYKSSGEKFHLNTLIVQPRTLSFLTYHEQTH